MCHTPIALNHLNSSSRWRGVPRKFYISAALFFYSGSFLHLNMLSITAWLYYLFYDHRCYGRLTCGSLSKSLFRDNQMFVSRI